ncbi:Nitrilase/cyanide hydratase and apolipoprotein N-acyltransferase [Beauveria brongniartii RCEF 3172]|uniref:Nitrilase/cyanide hydratase and apolipoprotein N-acyltransferase n=1 Tax=Beauveria brongniartii RCEF 3172 TaxID=1081107 RepID=A0A167BTW5_9HYPO|nr:Nitrilase/cyanide hydratase and apolipoprotein N-acyltransferase [Beauveria brongniartii RCEF 3172]
MATPKVADLRIATVQFESISGDKAANLATIARFAASAASHHCHVVAFHECCIPGYTFATRLSRAALLAVAEPVPSGASTQALISIARRHNILILAGFYERDEDDDGSGSNVIYNTYVCVSGDGLLARFRKLHPFISPHLRAGRELVVFDLLGWKAGILICYDNNVVENVRATALLGAEVLFAPHVTMCTPSARPGAGFVDTALNPIGMDDDQLKNGCSMVLDPFGDVLAECRVLGEDMAVAVCTRDKLQKAGGFRYRQARRPEIYGEILGREHDSQLKVAWM